MAETQEQEKSQTRLQSFAEALESGRLVTIRRMVNELHAAEIAHLLESLPPSERELVWEMVEPDKDGDILSYVNDDVRAKLIHQMETDELVAAAESLDTDDLADILQDLPDMVIHEVLQSMSEQDRFRLEAVLSYPEDTAGGLMNIDTVTVRPNVTIDVVLRYLRLRGQLPEMTDYLYVVNRNDKFLGLLSLADIVTKDPGLMVGQVMIHDFEPIPANMSAREVAGLFERRDLITAPVVDDDGRLLGRITIDDVVDVIREEAEHSIMSMAGLDEEDDIFAPVVVSSRRRGIWLGINLITALIASWVIGLFDATIEKVVALAVLMPIVASMGGIAGSQTLTLVIRGMALGHIGSANAKRILTKELAVGGLNGLLWALVVAVVSTLWFGNYMIGVIIAAAMLINLVAAALAGATIPLFMRRMGIDPALSSSVVLTTVTDVVGFFAFLGLATVVLL
ncbi:magnesium transporter [Candidatus Tenderia electrophaga]|jgi:magnesium transporter|uniref:Magnesium transporter MgtE n=1 Tax=Candidatus Tenderia electrophaga TaxID=1748243 RepID=A0A0S2T9B0_9GAMM|nr:magnesium transporter [Candidatus Tenderia electrophaga]